MIVKIMDALGSQERLGQMSHEIFLKKIFLLQTNPSLIPSPLKNDDFCKTFLLRLILELEGSLGTRQVPGNEEKI